MGKRFGSTIRIIAALFLSLFSTNLMPVMTAYAHDNTPPGNNGTVKVDGDDIDGGHDNDPHVGCSFKVEWFGYDTGPRTSKVTFEAQAPTAGQLASPTGTQNVSFTGHGSGNTLDHTETYTLSFTGAPQPNQGYHVKLTVNTDGSKGNDEKSKVFWVKGCDAPVTTVTPTAPTKVDPCGRANDGYIITATTGVKYYKYNFWGADQELSAGFHAENDSAYIYAVAQDGYKLTGSTAWWLKDYTNATCVTTVTPTAPTKATDPCGVQNDKYTIPATPGVIYKVNDVEKAAGDYSTGGSTSVTIKAYPASGAYALSGTTEWTLSFNTDACPVTVTPTAPTHSDVCGTYADTYTIPAKTGVVYKVNGVVAAANTYNIDPNVMSYTITAESAGSPYVLSGDTSWTFDFTNTDCHTATIGEPEGCVDRGSHDGQFTVTVTNNTETDGIFLVKVNNVLADSETIAAHGSHTFVLDGYAPGTYNVTVLRATYTGILPVGMPLPPFVFDGPSDWAYKEVPMDDNSVTIEQCPCDHEEQPPVDACPDMQGVQADPADCAAVDPGNGGGTPTTTDPGHVLGDATSGGHILATSTNVPNELPNTGASATNPWLTIVAAAIAFLAVRAITRKKLISGQI